MVTIFDFALGILVGIVAGLAVERIMGREPARPGSMSAGAIRRGRWAAIEE